MKLVLASKNAKKLVERNDILSHLGIEGGPGGGGDGDHL